jgi:PAS domain S-box-containing protein
MPKKSKSQPHAAQQEGVDYQPNVTEPTFPVVGVGASAGGLDAFTKLLKNLPADTGMALVLVQDFAGRILAWNRRAQEMYGYTEKEALQLSAFALIPEKSREEARGLIERLKRGEQVPPCETWRRTKDGREIRVSLTASALLDKSGNTASIATTEMEI